MRATSAAVFLLVAVVIAGTLQFYALREPHEHPPTAVLSVKARNGSVIVDHVAGDPVPISSLSVLLKNAEGTREVPLKDSSVRIIGDSDNLFECGERAVVPVDRGFYEVKVLLSSGARLVESKVYVWRGGAAGELKKMNAPVWVAELTADRKITITAVTELEDTLYEVRCSDGKTCLSYPVKTFCDADVEIHFGEPFVLRVYSNGTVITNPPKIVNYGLTVHEGDMCGSIVKHYRAFNETKWFENDTYVGWLINVSVEAVYAKTSVDSTYTGPSVQKVYNIVTNASVNASLLVRKDAREIIISGELYVHGAYDLSAPGTDYHEAYEDTKKHSVMVVINETGWCAYEDGKLKGCGAGALGREAYFLYYSSGWFTGDEEVHVVVESALRAKPPFINYRIEKIT